MSKKRLPKKADDMNVTELYEYFKEGIVELVEANFNSNGCHLLEPIVFIGVRKSALRKRFEEIKHTLPKEKYDELYNDISDATDHAIHTMALPLGIFFKDTGIPMLNDFGKQMARDMVDKTIRQLREIDYNAPMFLCFVSEAYMRVETTENAKTAEAAQKYALGQISEEEFVEAINGKKRVSEHDDAVERVVLMFETTQSSQIVHFEMIRNEEINYQELGKREDSSLINTPGMGLFSGMLHHGIQTNQN